MSTLFLFNIVLKVLARGIKQEERHIRKKLRLFLLAEGMILYVKTLQTSPKTVRASKRTQ